VEAIQACVTGRGWVETGFNLVALCLIGAAGCVTGAKLFRWESGQRFRATPGKLWLVPTLAVWGLIGWFAESRGRVVIKPAAPTRSLETMAQNAVQNPAITSQPPAAPVETPPPKAPGTPSASQPQQPWELLTEADINSLDFNVPPDSAVVTPIAAEDDIPDDATDRQLADLEAALPNWAPGKVADPVQRVLNLMCVAGVPDLVQNPVERYVPLILLPHLESIYPREKLVRILTWIALHPEQGTIIEDLSELGLEGVGSGDLVRERVHYYTIKFVARLTGRKAGQR
jgi:hypothetical protein